MCQLETHEPLVPDYNLLFVAPYIRDYGTIDTVIPSERNDAKLGTANHRLLKLAADIHHASDVNNELLELKDNFPVTMFLLKVLG
ncbi:MAG TPA: hypothetical protein ACHBX0_08955 [Arsenophonus sp.]